MPRSSKRGNAMNMKRCTPFTRELTFLPSRRDALSGLAGAAISLRLTHRPASVEAKRKGRKKPKKAKPNAFGCLDVGDPCKNADQCCSGICDGAGAKRTCRAHGVGTCTPDMAGICTAPNTELLRCNNQVDCHCIRTTSGSNFCADTTASPEFCADCRKDADCQALGFPAGTACAPVSRGICSGICETGMACLTPCGADQMVEFRSP